MVFALAPDVPDILSATADTGGWIILPSSDGLSADLRKHVEGKGWQITTLDEVEASEDVKTLQGNDPSDPSQVHTVFITDGPDGKAVRRTMTYQVRLFSIR